MPWPLEGLADQVDELLRAAEAQPLIHVRVVRGDVRAGSRRRLQRIPTDHLDPGFLRLLECRVERAGGEREHDDRVHLLCDELVDVRDLLLNVQLGVERDHLESEVLTERGDRGLRCVETRGGAGRIGEPDHELRLRLTGLRRAAAGEDSGDAGGRDEHGRRDCEHG